ncbi:hypothetical protein CHS0354_020331 [Potamilus streckersoni]|uniref:BTB domain-containing protein n=1 Tax=Potamilus streckersoni TaxID=2493646 RepID=A0AAE0SGC2_9BIVA|nr:hypothetical protein CHS0354_020331 [Potamilus streckersoni]
MYVSQHQLSCAKLTLSPQCDKFILQARIKFESQIYNITLSFLSNLHADWTEGGVLDSNRYMFENQMDCDVTFHVGKQRQIVKAHKYVLFSRSSVFYAMLCGPLQETGPIDVPDIEPGAFQQLLRFMYYEAFEPNGDCILALLYAAKKYAVHFLVTKCVKWLKNAVSVENVCDIFQQAHALDETDLSSKCLEFILDNGHSVIKQLSFKELSSGCVELIIKKDDFCAKEEEIYEAVKGWAKHECGRKNLKPSAGNMRKVLGGLRNHIRYALMDKKYFADRVIVDDILTTDEKLHLCRSFLGSDNLGATCFMQTERKPIFQKKHKVMRFSNSTIRCPTSRITHAIEFKCSRRVLLTGIVIYGVENQKSPSCMPHVRIELLEESKRSVFSMTSCFLTSEKKFQEILFDKPVFLKPTWYSVTLLVEMIGLTHCGVSGESIISIDDEVFIEFRNCFLSNGQTCVSFGQIPGLLLCI